METENDMVTISVAIPRSVRKSFGEYATKHRTSTAIVIADVLELIAKDNLFNAVMDR